MHTAHVNVHVGNIKCLNFIYIVCICSQVDKKSVKVSCSLLSNNRINLDMYVYYSGQIYLINAGIRVR